MIEQTEAILADLDEVDRAKAAAFFSHRIREKVSGMISQARSTEQETTALLDPDNPC
jgi:hypothetical protein